jgi:hypothetical protein
MQAVAKPTLEFSQWDLKSSTKSAHSKTFYIMLPDKTFILFQAVYSTMNSWSHSVQCTLRVYPGGAAASVAKTIGLGASDFKLSNENRSLDTGALKIYLVNGKDYQLYYRDEKSGLELDALVTVSAPGAFFIDEGIFKVKDSMEGGWVKSKFLPKSSCTGSFWVRNRLILRSKGRKKAFLMLFVVE